MLVCLGFGVWGLGGVYYIFYYLQPIEVAVVSFFWSFAHCLFVPIFIFFLRTTGPISYKLGTDHAWIKQIKIYQNESPRMSYLKGEVLGKSSNTSYRELKINSSQIEQKAFLGEGYSNSFKVWVMSLPKGKMTAKE